MTKRWTRTELRQLAHRYAATWIRNNLEVGAEIETYLGDDVDADSVLADRFRREFDAIADKLEGVWERGYGRA
jgi:hypothetical protein